MKCPACGRGLTETTVSDITVDACQGGCGGIWFSGKLALEKVDEAHEPGQELTEIEVDPAAVVDTESKRECPRCDGMKMRRRYHSPQHSVEIEECYGCGGLWLDAGELETVRELGMEREARDADIRATRERRVAYAKRFPSLKDKLRRMSRRRIED